ncbi:Ankyrin repeat-containing domain [Phytophthora cactorum]|nr:Ankyrin repeat-containing domain [Phytophthora cactorum]
MVAAKRNLVEVMTLLLVTGVDVDLRRSDGTTALHLAIASQHARAAKLLLDFDADAAVATNVGVTPLLLAAENGLSKLIKLLVKVAPQSVHTASNDGSNVLAIAAQVGQVEAVKMFLEAGVQVDLSNGAGRTPLMFAAGKDQVEAMKLLLAKGAAPNKTANDRNTALTIAAEGGHVEAVPRVNRSACPEVTALAAAAQNGHVEVIKLLLQNHAEIDAHDDDWDSALHEAVYSGQLEAARALVEANPSANVNKRNQSGWTPMMAAAHRNFVDIVELLVWKGASLNLKTNDGRTALHIAAEEGHTEVIRFLLSRGALVDTPDRMHRTPLMMAAYRGHKDAVQLLLDSGASLVRTDKMDQTPLEVALSNSKIDVATLQVYSEPRYRRRRESTSALPEPQVKRQRTANISP